MRKEKLRCLLRGQFEIPMLSFYPENGIKNQIISLSCFSKTIVSTADNFIQSYKKRNPD